MLGRATVLRQVLQTHHRGTSCVYVAQLMAREVDWVAEMCFGDARVMQLQP